jgi:hypothetical protein
VTTTTTLVAANASISAFVPTNDGLGDDWIAPAYVQGANDETWLTGTNGVGYDTTPDYLSAIGINVASQMSAPTGNTSVFVRATFNIPNQAALDALRAGNTTLLLRMLADDGFVAYLNGVEVASANAPGRQGQPGVLDWNSDAPTFVEVAIGSPAEFDVSAFRNSLQIGTNVLAIHGLNDANTSSDLLIRPELVAITNSPPPVPPAIFYTTDGSDPRDAGAITYSGPIAVGSTMRVLARSFQNGVWSALSDSLFSVPPQLRVAEIYYNPPGSSDDQEFIELVNFGGTAIDLTGIRLKMNPVDGQYDYEFLPTDANLVLPAGGRMVVAGNRDGFLAAYPGVAASALADREFTGNLDNGGETITLFDAAGGVIQTFTYDDAWHPTTDGDGYSLVVVDASAPIDVWNLASGWQASLQLGGSPGQDERITGDLNGDLRVDLVDVMLLQRHLGTASGASYADGDLNGDGSVTRADLAILAVNFGRQSAAPGQAPAAVVTEARRQVVAVANRTPQLRAVSRRGVAAVDSVHSAPLPGDELIAHRKVGIARTAISARRQSR